MTTPSPHDAPAQDAMPTTRGMNFFLDDRNFQFLCAAVMGPEIYERARAHLTDLGMSQVEIAETLQTSIRTVRRSIQWARENGVSD